MKVTTLTAAVCAAVLTTVALATPASAHGDHPPIVANQEVLADGLMAPFSLEVQSNGAAWITQNFPGTLTRVTASGEKTDVLGGDGDEISAVSARGNTVYYAQVAQDHTRAVLMRVSKGQEPVQVADLFAHEEQENPDAVNTYGFVDLPASCASQFVPDPTSQFSQPTYEGAVDTHPYASLATREGVYVADAGMNAILKVGYDGNVSTVAVLPPTAPVAVTAETAEAFGMPACVVGHSYRFEPVPTDVEVGPKGWLYVSTLPGGPEDASLGARGVVYKVNPWSGDVQPFAEGFVSATNLAVSKQGVVFVTELFGGADGEGQVSVVPPWGDGAVTQFPISSPAAIEIAGKNLYLTTDTFELGPEGPLPVAKLVKVSLDGKALRSYLG
ncbi:ScyD/ScyE family protein [Mycetocola miduiensis]|uniref:ScyD/ScyE family protein n=1 Tax=Mycetocola miduiensis TaxID=995034 RepID=A0A1I5CN08_9MICO|nr:ScyD/ScyE family protein [Mycetocola miduiensis]SFN88021.1 hypothetical protein SAMN05216219_2417 [Mycetocola miduiensis]